MPFHQPITDSIRQRTSCRTYEPTPISAEHRDALAAEIDALPAGPFGSAHRFVLAAATEQDQSALKGLGTYGFIRGATGFIIGAMGPGEGNLEDFGYQMERLVLHATDLGLGTCWLGGSFTKSRFARAIDAGPDESVPAVVAAGYPAQSPGFLDRRMRHPVQADHRFPWNRLFWNGQFGTPLTVEAAGAYASVVENVRRGPSASNKQPWRVVRCGDRWHLYIQRTPGYRDGIFQRLGGIADMQRIDLGIALCHWELSAGERNLEGHWQRSDPGLALPDEHTEYGITWVAGA